ncbi:MAG: autotransporter-associated beta strand repeat-containing protein [Verrucomicrobia bacterium]|nr:autotransporter-associated beta strand repeat-containing protein [Verrucomicrobiota bacterium]
MAALVSMLMPLGSLKATDIYLGAGGGIDAAFAVSGNTSGTNGLVVRVGAFLSQSNSTVAALGYNKLWVGNQISLLTAVGANSGNVTTKTISSVAGSFSSADAAGGDAIFETVNSSFNNQRLWVLVSNDSTFTSSTQYALVTSTDSSWTLPADVSGDTNQNIDSAQITSAAFGSYTGLGSSDEVNMGIAPTTALYWDAGNDGLGGTGTWSTTSTAWTTDSNGVSGAGPYAWGTTSGTDFYAGAGLTAHFGGTAGTVTVSGTVQAHNGLTFASDDYVISSGTINLAGGSAGANTITVTSSGHDAIISSALTGSNGMTKAGSGTARLDAANTYTGSTTINAGTLQANAANALGSTTAITVNSGGSLLISATNAVNNSATVTLAGGTVAMSGSGITDTVGTLTLSADSVIDLGSGSGARRIDFAASNGISWTGTLAIWNWNGTNMHGTSYGDGDRQIFFGNSASGLTQTQLNSISFYSGSGTGFIGNAFIRSTGEIAAIPEPEVYATALLLLAGLGFHYYRRRRAQALPVAA